MTDFERLIAEKNSTAAAEIAVDNSTKLAGYLTTSKDAGPRLSKLMVDVLDLFRADFKAATTALHVTQSQQKAQLIYPDILEGDELQGAIDAGSQNAQLSTALAVASIASGVGSALSLVLAATLPSRGRMAAVRPPVMFAGPSGVGLAWEMTW